MTMYLVTYDLVGTSETSENYKRLIAEIKAYASAGEVQKSVWVLKTSWTPKQIFDDLWKHMHSKDRLFIIQIETNAHWINDLRPSGWLKKFLESP